MKRIITVFLMVFPIAASANNDLDMRNQILDNQIVDLTNERDTKYEALQKCEKSTKGFKIAGLTTLFALAAIGNTIKNTVIILFICYHLCLTVCLPIFACSPSQFEQLPRSQLQQHQPRQQQWQQPNPFWLFHIL